jgi:hypothetical protein
MNLTDASLGKRMAHFVQFYSVLMYGKILWDKRI